jgi:prophage regulatory protein
MSFQRSVHRRARGLIMPNVQTSEADAAIGTPGNSRRFDNLPVLPETGFVRQRLLLRFVPFSKSTLWRRVKAGDFPAPVRLSAGITAWRAEDVRRWIAGRV